MYEAETYEIILNRMLAAVPSDVDKREGSIIYDALAPAAAELAQMYAELDTNIKLSFGDTASGEFLKLRASEFGVDHLPAIKAQRRGLFYDNVDAPYDVSVGSRFSISGVNFVVLVKELVGQFILECETAGVIGNQDFGTLLPLDYIPGLARAELTDVLVPGVDLETDESLRNRYLTKGRSPSASGNKADYVNWTLEVAGVGGVSVIPVRDGPGTVAIAIINTAKEPAGQTLVDEVQDYIAPPWVNEVEAETMTLSGFGVTIDTTQTDDTGDSVKMVYDVGGAGTITNAALQLLLEQPGIWQARVSAKVDSNVGTSNLLEVGIWNVSANAWAKISPSSLTDAVQTLQADDLVISYADIIQSFYWNGVDELELRVTRLQTDTTTTVWVDQAIYGSSFSKDTGEGKTPIGSKVTVEQATAVTISISATITIASGYNVASVKAAAQQAVADYIRSLAFTDDNDVRWVRIGQAILDTTGVQDYQNLLVNGGTSNIVIGVQEVAVLGTVTFT